MPLKKQEMENAETWSLLPEEIILNILSWLPVKSLLRLRCVCKSFCKLISNPGFVKIHLNHAIQEHKCRVMLSRETSLYSIDCENSDEAVEIDFPFKSSEDWVKILGSCNGLVCFTTETIETGTGIICIWNPSTKEYKSIPVPRFFKSDSKIAYGFGYDYKNDDYKLVSTVSFGGFDANFNWEVKVFTLRSDTWNNVQTSLHHSNIFIPVEAPGVLVNGFLHWKATQRIREDTVVLVSFDIGDEVFQEVPLPKFLHYNSDLVVCAFGGSLCIVANTIKDLYVDIWVMKDYGVPESWTKLFTIENCQEIQYLRPIHNFKNGEILFEAELCGSLNSALVSYDPKHERDTRVLKTNCISRWWDSIAYVGSLVSLNSNLLGAKNEEGSSRQRKKLKKN